MNTYNTDESGLQMGNTGHKKVFCNAANPGKAAIVSEPFLEKWIILLEYVSALKKKIKPLIIFTGKYL